MIWSAIIGDVKSAQRLIKKCNAKIVAMRDDRKKNALEYALEHEHLDIVELLIDAGASATPKKLLMIALKRGNKELCHLLIKKGATSSEAAVQKALNKNFNTIAGLLLLRLKGYI